MVSGRVGYFFFWLKEIVTRITDTIKAEKLIMRLIDSYTVMQQHLPPMRE